MRRGNRSISCGRILASLEAEDYSKLWEGFTAAFAAIGVGADALNAGQLPSPLCKRCGEFYEPQHITAKFCLKCRSSYERRKERDPQYVVRNRQAVAKLKLRRNRKTTDSTWNNAQKGISYPGDYTGLSEGKNKLCVLSVSYFYSSVAFFAVLAIF